jgi:hypothetical protein
MKHLFPEQNDSEQPVSLVQGIVYQHTDLASKLLHNIGGLQKYKKDIIECKKERSSAEYRCRELMAKLKQFDEPNNGEDVEGDSDPDRCEICPPPPSHTHTKLCGHDSQSPSRLQE